MIDQQHNTRVSECLCDHVSEWHSNIFQHTEEALQTYTEDVEEIWWTDFVHQQKEKLIWNTRSELLRVCHTTEWNCSKFTENKSSCKLIKIHKTEESTDFFRFNELLLMICHIALSHSRTFNMSYM